MKKNLITLIVAIVGSQWFANAGNDYYYYRGEKIPVIEDTTKTAVVTLKSTESELQTYAMTTETPTAIKGDSNYRISFYESSLSSGVINRNSIISQSSSIFLPCYKSENGVDLQMTNYLNVKLKQATDYATLLSLAERYSLEIVEQDMYMPLWYTLSITPQTECSTLEAANAIFETGLVAASSPDFSGGWKLNTNDPYFGSQWGLNNNNMGYSNIDISIEGAWNYVLGSDIKVAVIDTGTYLSHPDLVDNIFCSFDAETNTSPCLYYFGNIGESESGKYPAQHGTHVAGIVAAKKDNNILISGVAPSANLIPVSVNFLNGININHKLALAINWAVANGAEILNCSWGGGSQNDYIDDAINNALSNGRNGKGCIVVFSTGNDYSSVNYPANSNDKILSVGDITSYGERAEYSNYGNEIDVVAPGSNIYSTLPTNVAGYMSGTSMAAPHVSGLAALILSVNPNFSDDEVCLIIQQTCKKLPKYLFYTHIGRLDGTWNSEVGYGLINAEAAVKEAVAMSSEILGPSFMEKSKTYTFSLSNSETMSSVRWYLEGETQKAVITTNTTNPSGAISVKTQFGEPEIMTLNAEITTINGFTHTISKTIYPNTNNTSTFCGSINQQLCSYNNVTYPTYSTSFVDEVTQYIYPGCNAVISFLEDTVLGWTIEQYNGTPISWSYNPVECELSVSIPKNNIPYSFRFTSEYGTKAFTLFPWQDNSAHSLNLSTDDSNLYVEVVTNGESKDVVDEIETMNVEIANVTTGEIVVNEEVECNAMFETSAWDKGYYVVTTRFNGESLSKKTIIK